jgi:hypothetical protein
MSLPGIEYALLLFTLQRASLVEQVPAEVARYQCMVGYDPVPPDMCAVSVTPCPERMTEFAGVGAPDVSGTGTLCMVTETMLLKSSS